MNDIIVMNSQSGTFLRKGSYNIPSVKWEDFYEKETDGIFLCTHINDHHVGRMRKGRRKRNDARGIK